ncbi:MAG: hypothetical protein QOJ41_884 [Acidobacteriaceae bacterium]|nr:hypothetical protein [Acidobacteriaceae bacterium]
MFRRATHALRTIRCLIHTQNIESLHSSQLREPLANGAKREEHRALIRRGQAMEVAARAVKIESRTNLLFSFEKMALRDVVKSEAGARLFARGLYDLLYSDEELETRFTNWCDVASKLPREADAPSNLAAGNGCLDLPPNRARTFS